MNLIALFLAASTFAADSPTPTLTVPSVTMTATGTPTFSFTPTLTHTPSETRTATETVTQSTSLSLTATPTLTFVTVLAPGVGHFAGQVYSQATVEAGDTVANTTTETGFYSRPTLARGLMVVGATIRYSIAGTFGTNAVAPTLTLNLVYQGANVATTDAVTMLAGLSSETFTLQGEFTAVSATALRTRGTATISGITTPFSTLTRSGTVAFAVGTTSDLQVTAKWSLANAANTITQTQYNAYLTMP